MPEPNFAVGNFLTVASLALKVYNIYKEAPGDLKDISDEIKSLHIIVNQQKDKPRNINLRPEDQQRLGEILQGCTNVLKDLDELMATYRRLGGTQASLGAKASQSVDRVKWGWEDVPTLRSRLTSNRMLLHTFITR